MITKDKVSYGHMYDWSELTHDLLVEIAARIEKLEDFISFGAVCKGWCVAGKKEYFKKPWLQPRIPYLMLPVRDDSDDTREFYGLVEGQIMTSVRIPKFKERKCLESLGWLLAVESDGSMCLLDPFSNVEIPVPHQSTFPEYEYLGSDAYVFVKKIVLSTRPSETSDYILMIICGGHGHLAFWRPGDESWNRIEIRDWAYWDVVYYGGHFYAIDGEGYARVFTLEGDNPPTSKRIAHLVVDTPINPHTRNIEDVAWGDVLYILKTSQSLFMISRTASWFSEEDMRLYYNTSKFGVYEVDTSTGTWTEINNIGSMAIFVGHNTTFAIDTSRLSGKIKGNHIYFTDDGWECYYNCEEKGGGKDMGVYNLETKTIESFYSGDMLLTKVCPFIWITPSF